MRGDYVFERVSNTISTPSCTTHHTPHCTLHTANRTPYTESQYRKSVQKASSLLLLLFVVRGTYAWLKNLNMPVVKSVWYSPMSSNKSSALVREERRGRGEKEEGGGRGKEGKRERGRVNITPPHSTADSQHRTHSTTECQGVIPTALPSHHKTFVAVADATQTTTITKSHIS